MTPIEFVRYKDSSGTDWSKSTEGLVLAFEEFAAATNKEALEIIEKGTKNRRYWKNWEKKLMRVLRGKNET